MNLLQYNLIPRVKVILLCQNLTTILSLAVPSLEGMILNTLEDTSEIEQLLLSKNQGRNLHLIPNIKNILLREWP
jgi:hypothetical protein